MSLDILKKTTEIKKTLGTFSKSDFKHDFSINNTSIINALSETFPLTLSKVNYLKKVNELKSTINRNSIYEFLEDKYKLILPNTTDYNAKSEDDILNTLGINYMSIKNKVLSFDLSKKTLPTEETLKIAGIREYKLKFHPAKKLGSTYNLVHMFKTLTRKNKFVFIIDASYLSMSNIGLEEYLKNQYIGNYDTQETYEIYILENNENISDSANKIVKYTIQSPNIKLYILREKLNNIIIYPDYSVDTNESNLFTNINITSKKIDYNTVNAVLTIDGKKYEREDLGAISQIDRASFLALQKYILEGTISKEIMSYFLLKRAGDWCQALSLLDYSRKYDVFSYDNATNKITKTNKEETLNNLMKDSEIALITHDRILLSYALLLGINVFYSLKVVSPIKEESESNSITWCTYFQNAATQIYLDDFQALKNEKNKIIENINTYINESNRVKNILNTQIQSIDFNDKNIFYNVPYLRVLCILLNSLYIEDNFKTKYDTIMEYYNSLPESIEGLNDTQKKELSNTLYNIRCIKDVLATMNKKNTELITNIIVDDIYETEDLERNIIYEIIKAGLPINKLSEELSNYKLYVVYEFKKNYLELKNKNLTSAIDIILNKEFEFGRSERKLHILIDLLKEVITQNLNGGVRTVAKHRNLLTHRFKKPINKGVSKKSILTRNNNRIRKNIKQYIVNTKNTPLTPTSTSVSILNTIQTYNNPDVKEAKYYNDQYGNFYSNYGDYVITKQNLEALKKGLEQLMTKDILDTNEIQFVKQFYIYYLDELYTRLFTLNGMKQYKDKEKTIYDDEEDLNLEYLHIITQLFEIYNNYENYLRSQNNIEDIYNLYFIERYDWNSLNIKDKLHGKDISKGIEIIYETTRNYILENNRISTPPRNMKN